MATRGAAPADQEARDAAIPVGTMLPHPVATPPAGWLAMDGSEKATATYPALSALLGTTFGSASAGNFKLPDAVGRMVVGVAPGGHAEVNAVGDSDAVAQASRIGHDHLHTGKSHNHTYSFTTGSAGAGASVAGPGIHNLNLAHTHTESGDTLDNVTFPTSGFSAPAHECGFWMIKT